MPKFDDLQKLKELHDSGVVNDEEYETQKKKILDAPDSEPQQAQAAQPQPQIVINNTNMNQNTNQNVAAGAAFGLKPKSKWVSLLLCLFLGFVGAHKFYEGKIGLGIIYIFTGGLFFIGVIVDFIQLLFKPDTYYV